MIVIGKLLFVETGFIVAHLAAKYSSATAVVVSGAYDLRTALGSVH
jgi:hypothetical protein